MGTRCIEQTPIRRSHLSARHDLLHLDFGRNETMPCTNISIMIFAKSGDLLTCARSVAHQSVQPPAPASLSDEEAEGQPETL